MSVHIHNHILQLAKKLELSEQLKLLQALLEEISSGVVPIAVKKPSIIELKGLGREMWQEVDVEQYIEQERASWC